MWLAILIPINACLRIQSVTVKCFIFFNWELEKWLCVRYTQRLFIDYLDVIETTCKEVTVSFGRLRGIVHGLGVLVRGRRSCGCISSGNREL